MPGRLDPFPPFAHFPQPVCLTRGVRFVAPGGPGRCLPTLCALSATDLSHARGCGPSPRWPALPSRPLRTSRNRSVSRAGGGPSPRWVGAQPSRPLRTSRNQRVSHLLRPDLPQEALGSICCRQRVSSPCRQYPRLFPHFPAALLRPPAARISPLFQWLAIFRIFRNFRRGLTISARGYAAWVWRRLAAEGWPDVRPTTADAKPGRGRMNLPPFPSAPCALAIEAGPCPDDAG